jgi:hypothetical protein
LIVEHEEELLRDLNSNKNHGEDSDESDTSLQGDDKAAGCTLSELIGAVADTAACLRVNGSVFGLSKVVSIIFRGHCGSGIKSGQSIGVLFLFTIVLRLVVLVLVLLVFFLLVEQFCVFSGLILSLQDAARARQQEGGHALVQESLDGPGV